MNKIEDKKIIKTEEKKLEKKNKIEDTKIINKIEDKK